MKLNELEIGKTAKIVKLDTSSSLKQHFLDMGLIPGVEVTLQKLAPMGDPMELKVHGYELTLRIDDAKNIEITSSYEKKENTSLKESKVTPHPGLGEGGKFHDATHENPLPDDELLTFALAGNQNCGKTTLFNVLTGSSQHVGNFPGVTVDRKSGSIKKNDNTEVVDLPGIYSLSPYSDEEIVSREYILNENPKGIINIVDATNIERNLYLTLQLLTLEKPMTIALNMMDELLGNGGYIDVNKMEALLGVPVVPISAKKNSGVDELVKHALHVAHYQELPLVNDFCEEGPVHRAIHGIMFLIEDHAKEKNIPLRFAATKIIEKDARVIETLSLSDNEKDMIDHIILELEKETGLDSQAAIANMRYIYISKVCEECVVKPRVSKEHLRSQKIDKILTGKFTAIPSFILIMGLIFFLTFNVIGKLLQWVLDLGISSLTDLLDASFTKWNIHPVLHSLVIDGIFEGVGSVISFLPIIVTLFFFLSILEDSGYMARIAFVMDKLLRKIGLSGKSIVPMLIGFGCTVPGVMSTRTLSSERDRKMTTILTPFMSCSAKLPIYSFLCAIFFGKFAWLVMISLYIIGILIGILVAFISKKLFFKGEAVPFVMELPNYRLPTAKNVTQLLWEKVKDFLKKAFTIILLATIVIWFLQSFDTGLNFVEDNSKSILALISGWISIIFKPLGLGDYRVITALISGVMAKESVVATLGLLFGSKEAIKASITPCAGFVLLIFCLLYTPCVAALAAIKRELGGKWCLFVTFFQLFIAYLFALIFALIFMCFGAL